MFDIGFGELLLIAVVALVVLGPERLPKAARFAGLWVRRARAQWYSVKSELERELEAEELKRSMQQTQAALKQAQTRLQDELGQAQARVQDEFGQAQAQLREDVDAAGRRPEEARRQEWTRRRPRRKGMTWMATRRRRATMNHAGPESDAESSLLEHLLELRTRLMRALLGLVAVLLVLLPFANKLYGWLAAPLLDKLPAGSQLVAVQVASPFFTPMKLAFFAAPVVSAPWLLYQHGHSSPPASTSARSGWHCHCWPRRWCCSMPAARSPTYSCRRCSGSWRRSSPRTWR